MPKNLIHKSQLHPDISGLIYSYGSNYFATNSASFGNLVFVTGNQTVAGTKNFTTIPTVSGVNLALSSDVSSFPDIQQNAIYITGNQTVNGFKNFNIRPTVSGNLNIILDGETVLKTDTGIFASLIQLNSTGSSLNTSINSLSGYLTSNYKPIENINSYATKNDLTATGNNLYNQILILSGNSVDLISQQTIYGLKNFTTRPTVGGTGILLQNELPLLPNGIFYLTGDQTIDGYKNFLSVIKINGTGVLLQKDLAIEKVVYTTGEQTIEGVKKFNSRPVFVTNGTNYNLLTQSDANNYVSLSDDQTVNGAKVFTSIPKYKGSLSNNESVPLLKSGNSSSYLFLLNGNQTVNGTKTFTSIPLYSGLNGGVSYPFLTTQDTSSYVDTTSNQDIGGIKNFTTRPTVNSLPILYSGDANVTEKYLVTISGGTPTSPLVVNGVKTFTSVPTVNGSPLYVPGVSTGVLYKKVSYGLSSYIPFTGYSVYEITIDSNYGLTCTGFLAGSTFIKNNMYLTGYFYYRSPGSSTKNYIDSIAYNGTTSVKYAKKDITPLYIPIPSDSDVIIGLDIRGQTGIGNNGIYFYMRGYNTGNIQF